MKTAIQELSCDYETKINAIKKDFIEKIKQFPDNPKIKRLNCNCYIINFSQLTKYDDWTVFFHDFKQQYKYIIELVENNQRPINNILSDLIKIVKKGCIRKRHEKGKTLPLTFHPKVRDELALILK